MNAKQEAKLSMCQGVEGHLNDGAAIIAANVAFVSAFNNFKAKVASVVGTQQLTDLAITGFAVTKKATKQDMCSPAAEIAGVVFAFADATGNEQLKAEVDYSLSDLLKLKDSLVAQRCQNIHDKALENKDALKDYGITAVMLTDLQSKTNSYTETIPKPRAAVSNRTTLNANIVQLFKDIDAILLKQMDKLIVTFRATNPDFVSTYFNLRRITDPAVTATQFKGVVTDASDGTPIKDATVTIVELSKTAKTKASGEYKFKPIAKGTYTVRFSKAGFEDLEKDEVEVKLGEVNHLDAGLESA